MAHVLTELAEWREFYLMLGTAAAALLALLFVAISVAVGFVTQSRAAATRTFVSPIVVHFGIVLSLSGIALAPVKSPLLTASLIGLAGVVGMAVAVVTTVHVFSNRDRLIEPFDRYAYGVIPAFSHLVVVASSFLMLADNVWSLHVFGAAQMLLMLINIRNVWDLLLTIVREQHRREKTRR